jgi:uncharacterized short protein YbdD (DUF466 family)
MKKYGKMDKEKFIAEMKKKHPEKYPEEKPKASKK